MAAKKKGKSKKTRTWIVGMLAVMTLGLLIFVAGYIVIYMNGYTLLQQGQEKLEMAEATAVYDRNGEEIGRLYIQNRKLVKLDEVPDKLEQAIIATEDQRFEKHAGVDLWSIGRAIVKDIVARDLVEGGSTITQQLAKNMFLTADKTFFRKATEVSIALALENNFDKDEILAMYLNRIYYGNGAYGVKSAAELHFGVDDLNDLSLLEIAVLAGMPKAPETYSPSNNEKRALERAAVVLALMEDQGYITKEERRAALNDKLRKPPARESRKASAVRDYILAEAARVTGLSEQELRIGGYEIHTTVDATAQRAVDEGFANPELFPEDGESREAQGAIVIIDPKSGGIAAMHGGRNYVEKGLNRALAKRQPGSAFKPVSVYAPALQTGNWHPYSMLKDEKLSFGDYRPSNLSGKYSGEMTMLEAVKRSINLPAVWLLNEIGVAKGLEFSKKLGVDMDAGDRNLAIALGGLTRGASPLEMARAYGVFASGGMLAQTHIVKEVRDSDGYKMFTYEGKSERVMSEQAAYYMTTLLEEVVKKGGTGTRAAIGRPVAGKTGTTQLGLKGVKDSAGNRDIWFAGYTPDYAAAVWMGFDETDAKHFVKSGSGTAAAMFAVVMKKALDGKPARDFERPQEVPEPQPVQPPQPITDLSAFYDTERREAVLSWSAQDEGALYRLYRKEASEDAALLLLETEGTTVLDISSLPEREYTYYVTVVSKEEALESEPSNRVVLVVPAEDEGAGIGDDLDVLPDVLPTEPEGEDGEGGEGGRGEGEGGEPNGNGGGAEPEPEPQPEPSPDVEAGEGVSGGENRNKGESGGEGRGRGGSGGAAETPLPQERTTGDPSKLRSNGKTSYNT